MKITLNADWEDSEKASQARKRMAAKRRENELLGKKTIIEKEPAQLLTSCILSEKSRTIIRNAAGEFSFVMPGIAPRGWVTAIVAGGETGKTLIALKLLAMGRERDLNTDDRKILYVNADDSAPGIAVKFDIIDEYKIDMIVPGYDGFTRHKFIKLLQAETEAGNAPNITIVLDTLKKFMETMDKGPAAAFLEHIRSFVTHGGTVIMLAHGNKHKVDGRTVFAGTSDLHDDVDCMYIADEVSRIGGVKVVEFNNSKGRGDQVKDKIVIEYSLEGTYREKFDSVKVITKIENPMIKEVNDLKEKYHAEIAQICASLSANGEMPKTRLIADAVTRGPKGRPNITKVLEDVRLSRKRVPLDSGDELQVKALISGGIVEYPFVWRRDNERGAILYSMTGQDVPELNAPDAYSKVK